MEEQQPSVIRLPEKVKTITGRSEYLFHFTSHAVHEEVCHFEGYYKDPGLKADLHIHKKMTEIFTVTEGEFSFHFLQSSATLGPGDTIVALPYQPHGFSSNVPDSRMQLISIGFKHRENFFMELSAIINGETKLNAGQLEEFFNRYDQYTIRV